MRHPYAAPELTGSLLERSPEVYVILDVFDAEHMRPGWKLLADAERVYRLGEFGSPEEISAVAAGLSLRGVAGDRLRRRR